MKKVLLTHPGTQYSYALAHQLHRLGLLYYFATGMAVGTAKATALPARLLQKLVPTRQVHGVPDSHIWRMPAVELSALVQQRTPGANAEAILRKRNNKFQQALPQKLLATADVVIGFDTSSHILIERTHALKKRFILDASIAHPLAKEVIYKQLRIQYPQWAEDVQAKNTEAIAMEQQEMDAADTIVVATSFTKNSYVQHGVLDSKIVINPYGTDLSYFVSKWNLPHAQQATTVRFAFMGKISARKGIPWLLEVWPLLHAQHSNTQLIIAGNGAWPEGYAIPEGVIVQGFVAPHERTAFYHAADVFVFPSFFEGFGQVIIEAMACGLPVITTTHTAAPEIMTEHDGFVITPGDSNALFNALAFFAQNPNSISRMGKHATQTIAPYTWDAYGDRWGEELGK